MKLSANNKIDDSANNYQHVSKKRTTGINKYFGIIFVKYSYAVVSLFIELWLLLKYQSVYTLTSSLLLDLYCTRTVTGGI